MKKKKTVSKKASPIRKMIVVKMSVADKKLLVLKARRHTDGNISAWIRYASKKHTLKPGQRVNLRAA